MDSELGALFSLKPNQEQIEKLLALRERTRRDIERLEEDFDAAMKEMAEEANRDERVAEIAALAQNQEAGLSMQVHLTQLLGRVDAALRAIEDGNYGRCVSCGSNIPRERLEAVPYASRCVRCQSRLENRQ